MRQLGASKVEELRPDMVSVNYCLQGNINKMLLSGPTGGLGTMETREIVKELQQVVRFILLHWLHVIDQGGQIHGCDLAYDTFVWRPFQMLMKGPLPSLL